MSQIQSSHGYEQILQASSFANRIRPKQVLLTASKFLNLKQDVTALLFALSCCGDVAVAVSCPEPRFATFLVGKVKPLKWSFAAKYIFQVDPSYLAFPQGEKIVLETPSDTACKRVTVRLPTVKVHCSFWGRRHSPTFRTETPRQFKKYFSAHRSCARPSHGTYRHIALLFSSNRVCRHSLYLCSQIKILWCPSPYATAELFDSLKVSNVTWKFRDIVASVLLRQ